ncbi:uncharacterized protein LOC144903764 [Branchiostoma floridae x Branchiostoma belcheri]
MLADTMHCLVGFLVVLTNVVVLPRADTNIAVGRPAFQTSTSVHYSTDGVPSRAVDGNLNSNYRGLSCTHTQLSEHNPAWWVDLGNSFPINRVTVFNRQDCCWERINPFNIHVGDSDQVSTNPRCGGDYQMVAGQTYVSLPCYNMRGRYVGILLPGYDRILTLCEVQVYVNLALLTTEAAATTPAVTTTTPAVTTPTPVVTTTTPAVTTTTPAVTTTIPAVTTTTPAVTTPTPAVTTTMPAVTTTTPTGTTSTPAGTTTTPAGTTSTPVTTTVSTTRSSNDASIVTITMSQPKDPTSPTASLTTSRLGEGGSAAANKGGAPGGAVAGGVTGAMVVVGAGIAIGGFLLYRKKKKVAVEPTPSERAESS